MTEPEPDEAHPKRLAHYSVALFALGMGLWAYGWTVGRVAWFWAMGAFFAALAMVFSFARRKR
jgi:hypothetical protein